MVFKPNSRLLFRMRFSRMYGKRVVFADASTAEKDRRSDAGVLLLRNSRRAGYACSNASAGKVSPITVRSQNALTHARSALLAQRVCGMALGYEDIIDHDTLRFDPALIAIAGLTANRRSRDPGSAGRR